MKVLRIFGKAAKFSLIAGIAAIVAAAFAAIVASEIMAGVRRARGLFDPDLENSELKPDPDPAGDAA